MEISIITVTKNRKDILLRKLESIQNQSLEKSRFELILLDNNSTDGTKEALENLNYGYKIKIINTDKDLPVTEARNLCAQAAKGKYLYLSDDDCILAKNTLEKHLSAQKSQKAAYLGEIEFIDEESHLWRPLAKYWYLNGANSSFPKKAFDEVGGFCKELRQYGLEDLLLGYELKKIGLPFKVLADAPVKHIGPAPLAGKDLSKAFSAGQNTVIVTNKYPELSFRLGVSGWLLAIKKLLYLTPLQLITKRFNKNFDYEKVYLMGVLEQKQMMHYKEEESA